MPNRTAPLISLSFSGGDKFIGVTYIIYKWRKKLNKIKGSPNDQVCFIQVGKVIM